MIHPTISWVEKIIPILVGGVGVGNRFLGVKRLLYLVNGKSGRIWPHICLTLKTVLSHYVNCLQWPEQEAGSRVQFCLMSQERLQKGRWVVSFHQEDKEERAFWAGNPAEAKTWWHMTCLRNCKQFGWRDLTEKAEKWGGALSWMSWGQHHGVRLLVVCNGHHEMLWAEVGHLQHGMMAKALWLFRAKWTWRS